jgi:hypothetical protein
MVAKPFQDQISVRGTPVSSDGSGWAPVQEVPSQARTDVPTSGLSEGMLPSRLMRRIFPLAVVRQVAM